jgi:superfamily I DNA/RNA helicase
LIAGPGAGKIRTVTHGTAHRLVTEVARATGIDLVTFSARPAGELRLRLVDDRASESTELVHANIREDLPVSGVDLSRP